jgi:hypothetical protein
MNDKVCWRCKNFDTDSLISCEAFPYGIPHWFASNEAAHDKVVEGQVGDFIWILRPDMQTVPNQPAVQSNPCHNPAGPGGGQFCPTGGGSGGIVGSSWKTANSIQEAQKQFKDKFGDVFKGQGANSYDLDKLNIIGKETEYLKDKLPDKIWKSDNFKLDYFGIYNQKDWDMSVSFNAVSKNSAGVYDYSEWGGKIKLAGEKLSNSIDNKITIGSHLTTGSLKLTNAYRHEFGHLVHDRGVSHAQKNEWEKIFTSKSAKDWAKTVSRYGATNSHELFAESFAAYTSRGYSTSNKKLPSEIEFYFGKLLKRGK